MIEGYIFLEKNDFYYLLNELTKNNKLTINNKEKNEIIFLMEKMGLILVSKIKNEYVIKITEEGIKVKKFIDFKTGKFSSEFIITWKIV